MATTEPTLLGRQSATDEIFQTLVQRILSLDLTPGSKISEVEVANEMGVSRQPVRDAFYRLSTLGFLIIRPQRATTISLISEKAVAQATFIRTAIELETVQAAAQGLSDNDFDALAGLLAAQKDAQAREDKDQFHLLDDQFHREICERSGVGFAWDLIIEKKAHMDRVRMLTLDFASRKAWDDHQKIFDCLIQRDGAAAADAMREHLSRIHIFLDHIRKHKHEWFEREGCE